MHYRNIPKTLLFLLLCCPSMGLTGCSTAAQGDTGSFSPADYVNPFIGASTSTSAAGVYHGLGKTFPGATTPYGMVQVSPNTITGGDNSPGYSYEHTTIEGFAFTQMSGVGWFGDLGNLLVMPTTGPLQKIAGREDGSIGGYRSRYDKATETARAGYYSALLTDYGIRAESSATPHCGILRFTYPEADDAFILVDMRHTLWWKCRWANLRKEDDHTITGYKLVQGWGAERHVYFVAEFSEPLDDFGIMEGGKRVCYDTKRFRSDCEAWGEDLKFWVRFATRQEQQVTVRVAISSVDPAGARGNLHEIDGHDMDTIEAALSAPAASNCGSGSFRGSRSRARSGLRRRFTPRRTAVSSLRSFSRMRTAASASTTRVSGAPRDLPTIRPFRSGTPTAPSIR